MNLVLRTLAHFLMTRRLGVIACLALCPLVARAQLHVDEYIDPYDIAYVRIRCLSQNQHIYEESGNGIVKYLENLDVRDLRSHWFLQRCSISGQYYIRNRLTGNAMHIENQLGLVQLGAFNAGLASQRWIFNGGTNFFRIHNAWQTSDYFSLQVSTNQTLGYGVLNTADFGQQFVLEPLPRGAMLPWKSYDEGNFSALPPPAQVVSTSWDQNSMAADAQKRGCVFLGDTGTYVQWIAQESANALNVRYSVPDGTSGTVSLKVTPLVGSVCSQKVAVTSAQAWVYYDSGGNLYDAPGAGRTPMKRYNDARIKLGTPLQPGDTLEFRRDSGDVPIWIDVVEAETTPPAVASTPANYYNVKDPPWNAVGNGTNDDTTAIKNCIAAADAYLKGVYIPAGRYNLSQELVLPNRCAIQGAGMWFTELVFTLTGPDGAGGIKGNGSNISIRDLYFKGSQNMREGGYPGIKGYWGTNSIIENVWLEQTGTGGWIADFTARHGITDGLIVRNCRLRNLFADGINASSGTRNMVIDNCHVRGAGDDGLASWAAGLQHGVGMTSNQMFRYNTIECGNRAGGMGGFGGEGHKYHHNLVQDQAAGAGIRFSTVFIYSGTNQIAYPFGTNDFMRVYENTLIRVGANDLFANQTGGLELQTRSGNVPNITYSNIVIDGCQSSGIRFIDWYPSSGYLFQNIRFANVSITNVPVGTTIASAAGGSVLYDNVTAAPPATYLSNSSSNFSILDGAAPTGFRATNGNAKVFLDWNPAQFSGNTWNVKRSPTAGGPYTIIASPNTNSYTDTSALNCTSYYYVVTATNSYGETAHSTEVGVTLGDQGTPGPVSPTGLTATAGDGQVALNWNAAPGAASYNLKRSLVSGGPYSVRTNGLASTNYTETGLTNATTYYYVVSTTSASCGESTNSAPASATPVPFATFAQWQVYYFGSTNDPAADADADPDGDDKNNMTEFLTGTSPINSASAFRITSITSQGNNTWITWATAGGQTDVVQGGLGDLDNSSPSYSNLFFDITSAIMIPGSGDGVTNFHDDGSLWGDFINWPARYYRIRKGP